jgi:hypothetical protein
LYFADPLALVVMIRVRLRRRRVDRDVLCFCEFGD